jgi:ankyrin repeat protein
VLAVLIQAGADINQAMETGCSPVLFAARNAHRAVLAMLIEAEANINQTLDDVHLCLWLCKMITGQC